MVCRARPSGSRTQSPCHLPLCPRHLLPGPLQPSPPRTTHMPCSQARHILPCRKATCLHLYPTSRDLDYPSVLRQTHLSGQPCHAHRWMCSPRWQQEEAHGLQGVIFMLDHLVHPAHHPHQTLTVYSLVHQGLRLTHMLASLVHQGLH